MTSGGNNFNHFPENKLTKCSAKLLISDSLEHTKCSLTHRVGRGRRTPGSATGSNDILLRFKLLISDMPTNTVGTAVCCGQLKIIEEYYTWTSLSEPDYYFTVYY